MSKVTYTEHLRLRLKVRKIPKEYPAKIYENPEQNFFDNAEQRRIAVKKLYYNKKMRNMMIVYDENDGFAEIVTIHPISDEKIVNRVISGRWIKNE
ncbi:hypothetical protein HYW20_06595 [Candidatus Woesearchaeota archaeon]|nr:hypothetical protein [Candidatus Woesearchaeota archaeon]